jgi:predicted dithiol-disulfide oxidoreductase (DUF899 family)
LNAVIEQLEKDILDKKKQLAELRRAQPPKAVNDYTFQTGKGPIKLSELFGDKSELLLIHNMGQDCKYCSLWADGFNAFCEHLGTRSAFVLVSPDSPEKQREFATERGWKFPMASDTIGQFTRDMGMHFDGDGYWPGISSFEKLPDGTIQRVAWSYLGPGDDYCAIWHMLELLPGGPGEWEPR